MEVIIKICGALMILFSGTMIGWLISLRYKNRVSELRGLQLAVKIIDTEIRYKQEKFADAIYNACQNIKYPLSEIFMEISQELNKEKQGEFEALWTGIWQERQEQTNLKKSDIKIILDWGLQITSTPLAEMDSVSKNTLFRLDEAISCAGEKAEKMVKLSRYTGVLLSLLIIILFY
ncbi:MAG: hypothetical protein ACOC4G_02395 [Bacillota bacterium]